jgi:RNA polymerase Rpb4
MDFLNYIQRFPHLKYTEEMGGEDIEVLKERLKKTTKARAELDKYKDITDLELVQLYNLCPSTVEEAISWISSLDRFQVTGKEMYLKNILEVIHKHTPVNIRG